jgi:branched-chain amino acid transport system permease protein
MTFSVVQLLGGLSYATTLFLMAAGLTLIFGVTRIVNFAHGSFFMLGALFTAHWVTHWFPAWGESAPLYLLAILLGAACAGVAGAAAEFLLLRRMSGAPELYQLVATFGLTLAMHDAMQWGFGPDEVFAPRFPGLKGSVQIGEDFFPVYQLAMIALGPLVWLGLHLLLRRSLFGQRLRAATQDRSMLEALGVNPRPLMLGAVVLGCALAGLAGALQLPREPAHLQMDMNVIVETFVVVVMGGLGSIGGAFVAALLIGLVHAFGISVFPQATLVIVFLTMAVVLVFRPQGLNGKAISQDRRCARASPEISRPGNGACGLFAGVGSLCGVGLRGVGGRPLLAGPGRRCADPDDLRHQPAIHDGPGRPGQLWPCRVFCAGRLWRGAVAQPVGRIASARAGGRLRCGAGCGGGVRRSRGQKQRRVPGDAVAGPGAGDLGGRDAMGGPDGRRQRPDRAQPCRRRRTAGFLRFAGGACAGGGLRAALSGPLRVGRRASGAARRALRASASGLAIGWLKYRIFVESAVLAGLAGGLFAAHKGAVFPSLAAVSTSVDALLVVLLGGVHQLVGRRGGQPGADYAGAELGREVTYWRGLLGVFIMLIMVASPSGLMELMGRLPRFLLSLRRSGRSTKEAG